MKAWPLVIFREYIMTIELTEYSPLVSVCFQSRVLLDSQWIYWLFLVWEWSVLVQGGILKMHLTFGDTILQDFGAWGTLSSIWSIPLNKELENYLPLNFRGHLRDITKFYLNFISKLQNPLDYIRSFLPAISGLQHRAKYLIKFAELLSCRPLF